MNILDLRRYGPGICAAFAILAGCGGSSQSQPTPAGPSNTTGAASGPMVIPHPDRRPSWMAPDAAKHALLYVSNDGTQDVLVYSYRRAKLVGTLTGFYTPDGVCVDKQGDVWIVNNTTYEIVEYKHGGTSPVATLSDAGYFPIDCSVDPITGNLAVSNLQGNSYPYKQGNVAIYAHAKGTPTIYEDSEVYNVHYCGYDDKGNLYVDGLRQGSTSGATFAELPKGKKKLKNIALKGGTINFPGKVLWDGKYVAIGDEKYGGVGSPTTSAIYQTTGAGGQIVGKTPLAGSGRVIGFWIQGGSVVAPDVQLFDVRFYKYPAGGDSTKLLPGCGGSSQSCFPLGSAVSLAK
jgi:hypothetical protein